MRNVHKRLAELKRQTHLEVYLLQKAEIFCPSHANLCKTAGNQHGVAVMPHITVEWQGTYVSEQEDKRVQIGPQAGPPNTCYAVVHTELYR